MTITVNGERREVPDGATVAEVVAIVGLAGKPCAAEVNREFVARRAQTDRRLAEGDVVELVTLVGGG